MPPKLYDLTTFQREANRLFGYTVQQTLDYAQALYEKRLATYPRIDSQYLTEDMAVNGKVMGNLYELDHAKHVQEVKKNALPAETVLLTFKDGKQKRFPHVEYDGNFQRIQQRHGRVVDVRHDVKDDSALQAILKQQHDARQRSPSHSFGAYIKKLEPVDKPSVTERLKEANGQSGQEM